MKRLRFILLTNGLGLLLLLFILFGSQSIPGFFRGVEGITSHRSVLIDKENLKGKLEQLSDERLLKMYQAGAEILEWNRVLEKTGSHVVNELLKGQGMFYGMDHYPQNDVYDNDSYAQYYYHAHRKGEHGHFHLFLRQGGCPMEFCQSFMMDETIQ